ncbi:MAG: hypothetical protein AB8F94_27980 [Saprospiraceae bacterium]
MKRIDDKIKEIEKKDRINRLLYMGFILLIAGFMAYVLIAEKRNDKKNSTISELQITQSAAYLALDSSRMRTEEARKNLSIAYESLKKSLSPDKYWEHIENENTVKGYISFLTNKMNIDKSAYIDKAINKLKSSEVGVDEHQGWLYTGAKNKDGIYTSKDIVEVIYRNGDQEDISNSEIQIGDIVKLKAGHSRTTYKNKTNKSKNAYGWGNDSEGFVVDVWEDPGSTDFRIEIKYY